MNVTTSATARTIVGLLVGLPAQILVAQDGPKKDALPAPLDAGDHTQDTEKAEAKRKKKSQTSGKPRTSK